MKKLVSIMLLILLMFNFIFCNNVYAEDPNGKQSQAEKTLMGDEVTPSEGVTGEIIEEGTTSQTQDSPTKVTTSAMSYGASIVGVVTGIVARVVNVIVLQIDIVMAQLTCTEEYHENESDPVFWFWLTIERIVFNRVPLLNINYLNTYEKEDGSSDVYKVGDIEVKANKSNSEIKKSITGVYYVCRFIAMAIGLLVLIYIGIRMAISTVASDQAKYKKMLISWVESFILIFLMLYIISIVINFGEILTNVFYNLEQDLLESSVPEGEEPKIFEQTVRENTLEYTFSFSGLTLTFWSIVYWCLLFMEMKFLWTYMKRFLMVGFLIIISPLITITYSIDKAGDGQAQAFSNWFKEFVVNVLIQPLHALIYLVFVLTANNIAAESPIVALAFFMAMGTVEKMVKTVFNMKDLVSLRGLGEVNFFKKGK